MNAASILIMTAMAACFGQVIGRAVDEVGAVAGLTIGALTGVAAATIAGVRPPDPAGITWRRIEFLAFPIVGIALLGVSGRAIGVLSTVVTLVVVFTVRTLIESTAGDLATLDRVLDDRPTGAPPDRMRLRMLGVGLFLSSVAGYTAGVAAGFTDLARSAVGGQMLAVIVWFGLGIPSIGAVSRRARERAWRVNDVEVADGVGQRWAAGVAGAALVVVATAVIVPALTGRISAVPAQAIARTDGLNRFVTRALELLSRDTGNDGGSRSRVDNENTTALTDALERTAGDSPDWIGYLLLAAVIGTIFVWAMRAGRNARFAQGAPPVGAGAWSGVKALVAALGRELKALIVGLVGLLKAVRWRNRRAPARIGTSRAVREPSARVGWAPADPNERRIARSFATMVGLEAPRRGETPAEVARSVGAWTDATGAETVLGGYLRARYSPEDVETATADGVERAARRVVEAANRPDEDPAG